MNLRVSDNSPFSSLSPGSISGTRYNELLLKYGKNVSVSDLVSCYLIKFIILKVFSKGILDLSFYNTIRKYSQQPEIKINYLGIKFKLYIQVI